jgi:hypothetical protein
MLPFPFLSPLLFRLHTVVSNYFKETEDKLFQPFAFENAVGGLYQLFDRCLENFKCHTQTEIFLSLPKI